MFYCHVLITLFWEFITLCSDFWLRWGLKQTCSFPQELYNGVSHFTYTHQGQVDSQFLVVGSQTTKTSNITYCEFFFHYILSRRKEKSRWPRKLYCLCFFSNLISRFELSFVKTWFRIGRQFIFSFNFEGHGYCHKWHAQNMANIIANIMFNIIININACIITNIIMD